MNREQASNAQFRHPDVKTFEFNDHKLLLNIFAENRPDLAPTLIGARSWTAFGTSRRRSSKKSILSRAKSAFGNQRTDTLSRSGRHTVVT
jgi:hypothetical protein